MEDKIQQFADLITAQQRETLQKSFPSIFASQPDFNDAKVKPGKKYVKVDVGASGQFMVDQDGNIFGIKAYGVIHRGHQYGTLDTIDQYFWGDYSPRRLE